MGGGGGTSFRILPSCQRRSVVLGRRERGVSVCVCGGGGGGRGVSIREK